MLTMDEGDGPGVSWQLCWGTPAELSISERIPENTSFLAERLDVSSDKTLSTTESLDTESESSASKQSIE